MESNPKIHPLFEQERPSWEIPFADVSNAVMSVMPGESNKTFYDPIMHRQVHWEQDVYCPALTIYEGKICGLYRAFGDDEEWRLGYAQSDDGLHFERSAQVALYPRPEDEFLGALRTSGLSITYGDPHVIADTDGTFYLYFNFLHFGNTTNDQQLVVATSRDLRAWQVRGRIFASESPLDRASIPERSPWRLCVATVVSRLEGDRLVAARIRGKYWMYFSCYATQGDSAMAMATSDNLVTWKVLRDDQGQLVNALPARPGRFDSWYTDPVAAVLRDDGVLLIYNGVNQHPEEGGEPRLQYYAHYPAQALFARDNPARLIQRSTSPFKGGDAELEKMPIVFWTAPVYEAWSLVPFRGKWLLYWNHVFGRRSVGLWKAPLDS